MLKHSGRLLISDRVLLKDIPKALRKNARAYVGCISGAEMKSTYTRMIKNAGFKEVKVVEEKRLKPKQVLSNASARALMEELNLDREQAEEIVGSMASLKISATKP